MAVGDNLSQAIKFLKFFLWISATALLLWLFTGPQCLDGVLQSSKPRPNKCKIILM